MKRIFLLSSILLLSAVWALAQSGDSKIAVDGFLTQSHGEFSILDKASGNTYRLNGDTETLEAYVGHRVHVTGTINQFGDESVEDLPKDMGGPTESDIVQVNTVEDIVGRKDTSKHVKSNGVRQSGGERWEVLTPDMGGPR